jgi:hypothetical protein
VSHCEEEDEEKRGKKKENRIFSEVVFLQFGFLISVLRQLFFDP